MLWVCVGCSTRFAVGLSACPHCGGGEYWLLGEDEDVAMIRLCGDKGEMTDAGPPSAQYQVVESDEIRPDFATDFGESAAWISSASTPADIIARAQEGAAAELAGAGRADIIRMYLNLGLSATDPEDRMMKPNDTDLKAVWVDYALALGVPRVDAESMTKARLIAILP